jgi:hypothetical protein
MSHWSTAKTNITDVNALKEACSMLKLNLVENSYARGWNGQKLKADYVIKLDGRFDVALVKDGDAYSIMADMYDGSVEKVIGKDGNKLKQAYSAAATIQIARQKGYPVEMQTFENGDIKLILKVGAGG